MGFLCIDGELILTLLLFHSHIDNVKMSLKVDRAASGTEQNETLRGV